MCVQVLIRRDVIGEHAQRCPRIPPEYSLDTLVDFSPVHERLTNPRCAYARSRGTFGPPIQLIGAAVAYCAVHPPSIRRLVLMIIAAAGDARHSTAAPILGCSALHSHTIPAAM
jgi:hypothetical protein